MTKLFTIDPPLLIISTKWLHKLHFRRFVIWQSEPISFFKWKMSNKFLNNWTRLNYCRKVFIQEGDGFFQRWPVKDRMGFNVDKFVLFCYFFQLRNTTIGELSWANPFSFHSLYVVCSKQPTNEFKNNYTLFKLSNHCLSEKVRKRHF